MIDLLRPFLARALAAWGPALAAWLSGLLGFEVTQEMLHTLVALGGALMVYGPLHKFLDRWLNPGDAASITIAKVEKEEHAELKAEKNP